VIGAVAAIKALSKCLNGAGRSLTAVGVKNLDFPKGDWEIFNHETRQLQ
jgi:hypothetical protein